jgi:toxin HigB-1
MMIASFRHKGLRLHFEADDRSKLRQDQVRRIAIILAALDDAGSVDDLNRPSFRLHPLKGELAGYWSVWVNGNWRIVFKFGDGHATDVDLVDYH